MKIHAILKAAVFHRRKTASRRMDGGIMDDDRYSHPNIAGSLAFSHWPFGLAPRHKYLKKKAPRKAEGDMISPRKSD